MRIPSHQTPLSLARYAPTLQPYHPFFGSFTFHPLFSLLYAVLSTQNVLPLVLHMKSHLLSFSAPYAKYISSPCSIITISFLSQYPVIPCMTFIKTCNVGYLPNSHSCFFLAN